MAGKRKGTYKITNWRKYNESLVQRGSITFWFSDEVIDQWHHANDRPKVGHPFVYSDTAIECLLALRELFQLRFNRSLGRPTTFQINRDLTSMPQVLIGRDLAALESKSKCYSSKSKSRSSSPTRTDSRESDAYAWASRSAMRWRQWRNARPATRILGEETG